jgi:galactokinase
MHRRATIPARINIIGEHTDYAGGKSLAFAVDVHLVLDATSMISGFEGDPTVVELWQAAGGWPARLSVTSSIPIGAGMSSSAALCLAVTLCANGSMGPLEACKEAQRLEHEILMTPCGLLDMPVCLTFLSKVRPHWQFLKIGFSNSSIPKSIVN